MTAPLLLPATTMPKAAPDRGNRHFNFLTHTLRRIERNRKHLALVAGREYQAIVDGRTQP